MAPQPKRETAFEPFDPILAGEDVDGAQPWRGGHYIAETDLLQTLLTVPISTGDRQESGRPAKAFDAWIAHELRRAGFAPNAVWPRTRRPRVLPEDLAPVEAKLDHLAAELRDYEHQTGKRLAPSSLRQAIRALDNSLPGAHEAYVLGDFYSKQIDVAISTWRRGPDVLISTKTQFSSYRKNLRNRHEEAVGEVKSLRARHPMATMGYAYMVRRSVYEEDGAYALLHDILARLRRPSDAFDATMLIVVDWDETEESPAVSHYDAPDPGLAPGRFFADIVDHVTARTPIGEHQRVRTRRSPPPPGGLPGEGGEADLLLGDDDQ